MSPLNQTVLRNTKKRVTEFMNPGPVLTSLESKGILTTDDVEEINNDGTRRKKNENLVDFIRGHKNRAFNCFLDALKENEQEHVMKIITDELAGLKFNALLLVFYQIRTRQ